MFPTVDTFGDMVNEEEDGKKNRTMQVARSFIAIELISNCRFRVCQSMVAEFGEDA